MAYYRRSGSKTRYARRRPAYGRRAMRRRPASRRRYGRGSSRTRTRTRVRIPGYIQPDYTLVKFKDRNIFTTDSGSVPTAAGHVSTINFTIHGNDLYSAFALVPGALATQPSGFNQWMAFYNNFVVHQSGIQITPIAISATSMATIRQIPFTITICPISVNTLAASSVSFDEQPYSRTKTFNGGLSFIYPGAALTGQGGVGQQRLTSVSNSIMTKKIMGVKDIADGDTYKGSRTASPGDMFYWEVVITSLLPWDGTSNVANYTLTPFIIQARMFYKAQLLDRMVVPDSGEDPESEPEPEDP